jgi:hypothetical protein
MLIQLHPEGKMRRVFRTDFVLPILASAVLSSAAAEARAIKFPLPQGTTGLQITRPNTKSCAFPHGDVAGTYFTAGGQAGHSYGFIRSCNGHFTKIDVESYDHHTTVEVIDNAGDVAGQYEDKNNPDIWHAFIRTPDGTITSFDGPGAYNTFPSDLVRYPNPPLVTIGWYYTADGVHGFRRAPDGTLTTIDYPGAIATYPSSGRWATGIGFYEIAGAYDDASGRRHGFFTPHKNLPIRTLDPPDSTYTGNVWDGDDNGLSGIYRDGAGTWRGFFFVQRKFSSVDQPISRMNTRNQAVGQTLKLRYLHGRIYTREIDTPPNCYNLSLAGISGYLAMSGTVQCGKHGVWFGYLVKAGTPH